MKLSYAWLIFVALTTGCSPDNANETGSCNTFRTTLSVKDRMSQNVTEFNPNERVTFELEITNATNAPATLTAGSSCTAVVFEVFDAAKRRLWGSADNIACIQMLQPRTYEPLEVATEASDWDQRDSHGMQVPPGVYEVTANVGQYASDSEGQLIDCRAPLGRSATITIR